MPDENNADLDGVEEVSTENRAVPSVTENILEIDGVTKTFPGVIALSELSFSVKRGEIHGICGENGAGKSTLMKVLSGVYPHDSYSGSIRLNGEEIKFEYGSIRQAIRAGISIVYQELALNPFATVGENIYLGKEPVRFGSLIDCNALYSNTRHLLDTYELDVPFGETVGHLGVGKQQMVEIAKAVSEDARILILDEPTSALNEQEVHNLHKILRRLKDKGVTCLYISHKLEEFFQVADTVTVFRDGQHVSTLPTSETDTAELIRLMVGREMTERFPARSVKIGGPVLSVKDYRVRGLDKVEKLLVDGVSFELKKGEILGIAGLMGSGRTELVTSLFGEMGRQIDGSVILNGGEVKIKSAREAINHKISLVPEDRKSLGLILEQTILKNIALPNMDRFSGFMRINKNKELAESEKFARHLRIKAPSLQVAASSLSGGNQQKVVISKWLMSEPDVLILDDPTRGIDVGAKYEIYKLMNDLVENGVSIIMISSELEEVLGMSDRIMVMCEKQCTGVLHASEATRERIMELATMVA